MFRFTCPVFAAVALVGLAGCDSNPPSRTSPVLAEVATPFEQMCRYDVRSFGSYLLDCEGGLWRLEDGAAEQMATGGPAVPPTEAGWLPTPFVVGDDESAWALDPETGLVHAWDGASWTVHDIPTAIGYEWSPTIGSLAVRSKDDAYAVLWIDQSLQVLCHWDGAAWTPRDLSDMGIGTLHVTPSFLYIDGEELYRLAPDGSIEVVDIGLDSYFDSRAIVGDESMLFGSYDGLFHWNGTETVQVYEGRELQFFVARSEDDVWAVWREEAGGCTESDAWGRCEEQVSNWRQYRALHWDGSTLVETGHIDRLEDLGYLTYLGGGASPEIIVPSGDQQAWLDVEGWVEAAR